jgi:hypothetical protein
VVREFPHGKVGARRAGQLRHTKEDDINFTGDTYTVNDYPASEGSASRFFKSCPIDEADYACLFYCAKASKAERNIGCEGLEELSTCEHDKRTGQNNSTNRPDGSSRKPALSKNNHPTVKPLSLMCYLVRLVTPPGGTVLDPFAGSGTTIMAAVQEGFNGIGIEQDADHVEIARCRVEAVSKVEEQLSMCLQVGGK